MRHRRTSLLTLLVIMSGIMVVQAPPALAHNCDANAYVEARQVDATAVGTHSVNCGAEMYKIEFVGRLFRHFKEGGNWVLRGLDEVHKECTGDSLYRCHANTYLPNPSGEQKWYAQTEACWKHEWYSVKECSIASSGVKYF